MGHSLISLTLGHGDDDDYDSYVMVSDSNAGRNCECCDDGDGGGVDGNDGGDYK